MIIPMRPATGSTEWVAEVLAIDRLAGDMDTEPFRILSSAVVHASRRMRCLECDDPIVKGELVWRFKNVDRDGFWGGNVCVRCCDRYIDQQYPDDNDP